MAMRQPSKIEYEEALRSYFHKTKGYVFPSISHKIEGEIITIEQYDDRNKALSKSQVIIKACLNFIAQLVGTIIYCTLAIYVLKEVFGIVVIYSFKNILLLTIVLLAYKVKFRLAESYNR
jgi:pantothenate kinase